MNLYNVNVVTALGKSQFLTIAIKFGAKATYH